MLFPKVKTNSRSLLVKMRLIVTFIVVCMGIAKFSLAHQAPYSVAYLDITPNKVSIELHIPLSELALAMYEDFSNDPQNLLQTKESELRKYILQHTQAYTTKNQPWQVDLKNLELSEESQITSVPAFWELKAHLVLLPNGASTRHFYLAYDGVVHQVGNHIIFVVVRNDWETGRSDSLTAESNPMNIRIGNDNHVHPLEINLDKGSNWTGFKNMFSLGLKHIQEGTDHLMFLLVLLLPAPLIARSKRWADFGGVGFSFKALLKIITAFTVGHSITLLLGAAGWFVAPSHIVEILIAVSILISAIHAIIPIFSGKEYLISGGFGLIHGMAFASVLSEMNLSSSSLVISILGFNIGIEVMQLFVVLIVFPWLLLLSRTPYYSYFRIGGATFAVIASIAWISERITNNSNWVTEFISNEYSKSIWLIAMLAVVSIFLYFYNKQKRPNPHLHTSI